MGELLGADSVAEVVRSTTQFTGLPAQSTPHPTSLCVTCPSSCVVDAANTQHPLSLVLCFTNKPTGEQPGDRSKRRAAASDV